ncbi:MAG: branched-chain amino acid ABC transporter permease [Burkholderiaceae bacterium]|nr:branched-chain amino acid ABC transporter permease [Burkholderiaceae bacterium]
MPVAAMHYQPLNLGRWIVWTLFAVLLAAAPRVFGSGGGLSLLSLTGTVMIFALSYNMLLGQGGMLSFGHAVYSGLGAFIAIHAINLAAGGSLPLPLTLVPLVGGVAGLLFGALFGYVTTKRSGTTFAMISLGIVELVFACSLMFPGFFGGEAGISGDRVYGKPWFGISYGPQVQVYYLIAFWLFVSTVAMFALAHTPLGRIANAVRDNPERVEFIGYDTQRVRWLVLMLSGFFAGISGALSAINFEIVTAENVSLARSGAVLLFTFIGGTGFFFGPLLGAIVGVFMTVTLSEFTKAWQLYLGLFFILMVMYAPGGLASLLMMNLRIAAHGMLRRVLPVGLAVLGSTLVAACGAIVLIEMLYHWSLEAAQGSAMSVLGVAVDTASPAGWLAGAALLALGALSFRLTQPPFARVWGDANAEIERLEARRTA